MKKAFTIIELMVVVGILAILLTLVTTAAADSLELARRRKAQACASAVQEGLSTYYAQKGYWPGTIGKNIQNGTVQSNYNSHRDDIEPTEYLLDQTEADEMVKDLVMETKKRNPMLDISGLFVSRSEGREKSKDFGLDFMQAIRGTKQSRKKMKTSEMHFGYPNKKGYFRPFKIVYSLTTDAMTVTCPEWPE